MPSSSRRMPRRTAPSRPIAPNSEVGQATVNNGALKPPPAIACAPSPYPFRSTIVPAGTVRFAPARNMRAKWRTVAVGVDRAAEVGRVIGHDTERVTLAEGQRRDHARPEPAAHLEHGSFVEQRPQDPTHVIDPLALFGDQIAQQLLIGYGPGGG